MALVVGGKDDGAFDAAQIFQSLGSDPREHARQRKYETRAARCGAASGPVRFDSTAGIRTSFFRQLILRGKAEYG